LAGGTRQAEPTGDAALLLSDRGAYFKPHPAQRRPRGKTAAAGAALFGPVLAAAVEQMADAALERSGRVGHLETLAEAAALVDGQFAMSKLRGR